ncbi:hypothetical protein [Pontibacter ramchanderi]|uniref:hypothetical protein n=1 Tax=Pontibacter ramchanderi TaxID=1179743 RepID=UPI0015D62334|nr:hypothetical protein [Pontibacter ramchanderi]
MLETHIRGEVFQTCSYHNTYTDNSQTYPLRQAHKTSNGAEQHFTYTNSKGWV